MDGRMCADDEVQHCRACRVSRRHGAHLLRESFFLSCHYLQEAVHPRVAAFPRMCRRKGNIHKLKNVSSYSLSPVENILSTSLALIRLRYDNGRT
jgi:hypothetical protein